MLLMEVCSPEPFPLLIGKLKLDSPEIAELIEVLLSPVLLRPVLLSPVLLRLELELVKPPAPDSPLREFIPPDIPALIPLIPGFMEPMPDMLVRLDMLERLPRLPFTPPPIPCIEPELIPLFIPPSESKYNKSYVIVNILNTCHFYHLQCVGNLSNQHGMSSLQYKASCLI